MARAPFRPREVAQFLNDPAYRYRRILYSAGAWALAPHGGNALLVALVILGLVGVAVAATSISVLPRAPAWLPLIVAVTPGVPSPLHSRSPTRWRWDSRCSDLPRLPIAAGGSSSSPWSRARSRGRRWCWPRWRSRSRPGCRRDSGRRWWRCPWPRLGAWIVWVDHALEQSAARAQPTSSACPLVGWVRGGDVAAGLVIGLLLAAVMVIGVRHAAGVPHVRVYLVLLLVLMAVLGDPLPSPGSTPRGP